MKIGLWSAAALLSFGLLSSSALAAPQMLGVVASAEPVPMHCEGGVCRAELSAFCLEKERTIPQDGTAYEALEPEKLTLVVKGADGALRRIAGAKLALTSRRSQVAIEVSLPEAELAALGAVSLAVEAKPELALSPVAVAGDPKPIRPEDVARARDALAGAGALIARGDARARIAGLYGRLVNALPGESGADPARAEAAWQSVTGIPSHAPTSDPLLAEAARVFESCRLGLADIWPPGLRRCLEASHDAAMGGLNADIWKIVGTGS